MAAQSRLARSRSGLGDWPMKEKDYLCLGLKLINRELKSTSVAIERFTGHYGVRPIIAALLWDYLFEWTRSKKTCTPKHLLWALHFLTTYDTEITIASRFGVDEKTYRKWLWFMLEGIVSLVPQLVRLLFLTIHFTILHLPYKEFLLLLSRLRST
jgi:hypothetical protein